MNKEEFTTRRQFLKKSALSTTGAALAVHEMRASTKVLP